MPLLRFGALHITALVLSIIALLKNAWFAWLRWPRIAVEVSKRVLMSATFSETVTLTDYAAVVVGRDEPSAAPPAADPAPPQQAFTGTAKLEGETFVLTVINNGSDAITIKTIGFRPADQRRSRPNLDFLETWRSPGRWHSRPLVVNEALLPDRIEGHDCRIYEYSEDALKTLPAGEYRDVRRCGTSHFASGRSATDRRCSGPGTKDIVTRQPP